jgi:Fe-S oxidoreductase
MQYFHIFALPFCIGFFFIITYVVLRILRIGIALPLSDKRRILRNIFTYHTLQAVYEIFCEVLLHRRIWKENIRLGYMHTCFALGWFLLIVTGWIESYLYTEGSSLPIWQHIFFKYFAPGEHSFNGSAVITQLMDLWLAFILSGQLIAILKRFSHRSVGFTLRPRHTRFNQIAMLSLWFVFPLRLIAESVTAAIYGGGGFLTGSLGGLIQPLLPDSATFAQDISLIFWWSYSIALGVFFCCIPFSRYMHIPVEAFLILARHWKIRDVKAINRLETMACSACGMCLSNCPLARNNIAAIQPVYFIERLRNNNATDDDKYKCLQCGRCQQICPVRVHSQNLRQELKGSLNNIEWSKGAKPKAPFQKVVLFSGCMGKLTPRTRIAMSKILDKANVDYVWIDEDKDLCCGRPRHLNGDVDGAHEKLNELLDAITSHKPDAIITTCPICYNMLKNKAGSIHVMHHSDYITLLLEKGVINVNMSEQTLTYHDPCELSRVAKTSQQPLSVLEKCGSMIQPTETGSTTRCCGGALAAIGLSNENRRQLAQETADYLSTCSADKIVTACPLCKKTIAQRTKTPVEDIAEIVAKSL